jgi:hypothetical protein
MLPLMDATQRRTVEGCARRLIVAAELALADVKNGDTSEAARAILDAARDAVARLTEAKRTTRRK